MKRKDLPIFSSRNNNTINTKTEEKIDEKNDKNDDENFEKNFPNIKHPFFKNFIDMLGSTFDYDNTKSELIKLLDSNLKKIKSENEMLNVWYNCIGEIEKIKVDNQCFNTPSIELLNDKDMEKKFNKEQKYVILNNITEEDIHQQKEANKQRKLNTENWKRFISKIDRLDEKMFISKEEIINEFNGLYERMGNNKAPSQYKATIFEDSTSKEIFIGKITEELEKQIGLCKNTITSEVFYHDGYGRLKPFNNRSGVNFLYIIKKNTLLLQGKKKKELSTAWIDDAYVYKKIPLLCANPVKPNTEIVGFENCFYDITENKQYDLNESIPLLASKNCSTELILTEEIEDNPMQNILDECFTKKDKQLILCYLGCCLYDKGYTQRQESLFLMGGGNLGKTTFVRSLCSIFDRVAVQSADKLTKNNQFGLSVFAHNDIVIVDEITTGNVDFIEKIKEISSGNDIAIEEKNKNTFIYDAELVPRMFLIGNNIPKALYEKTAGAGATRRINIINPIRDLKELNHSPQDLITPTCKKWLVQQATKAYVEHKLHKNSTEISIYSDEQKEDKLYQNTYPEIYMLKKHFKLADTSFEDGKLDYGKGFYEDVLLKLIHHFVHQSKLEPTISPVTRRGWIGIVKSALELPKEVKEKIKGGRKYIPCIEAKTKEVQKIIDTLPKEDIYEE